MLPGSDFGIQKESLITRIAFVDFDGSKAINYINNKKILSEDFLEHSCPKIIKGITKLKKWVETNN